MNLNTADKIKSLVMHSCDTWLSIVWPRCCSLDTELIIWFLNNTDVSQSLALVKKISLLLLELKFTWNSSENCLHIANKTHNDFLHAASKIISSAYPNAPMMTSSQTSTITAEKNSKWPISSDFSHFTSIIWPIGRNNLNFNNGGGLLSSALLFIFYSF